MPNFGIALETGAGADVSASNILDMVQSGLEVAGKVISYTWNIVVGNPILAVGVTFGLITAGVGIFAAIKNGMAH